MNLDIVLQAVEILHEMHQIKPETINYPLEKFDCDAPKFLHGDLTPSNMLISYGKIMGVIDFELSILGPVEYDLARLAIFSWFRMGDTPFLNVLQKVKEKYPEGTSLELLEKFSLLHCQMHLDNIKKHEKGYIDEKTYQEELIFTEGRLKVLMADLAQSANPIL